MLPFVTVTVTVFLPSVQVAASPFVTAAVPLLIEMVAVSLVAVAVIASVALVVAAVYAVTPPLKVGASVSEPIVSPDRLASKGLRLPPT